MEQTKLQLLPPTRVSKPKKDVELVFRAVDEKGNLIIDSAGGVSPARKVNCTGFRAAGEPPTPSSSRLSPGITSHNSPNPIRSSVPQTVSHTSNKAAALNSRNSTGFPGVAKILKDDESMTSTKR